MVAVLLVWLVPALSYAEIKIETSAVGADVKDRVLVGSSDTFMADIGRVYYHNTITGDFGEADLEHVWKHGDDEVGRVSLHVKSPGPWRTWSYKSVPEWATGTWTVSLVDGEGKELAKETFTVKAMDGSTESSTDATPAKQVGSPDKRTETKSTDMDSAEGIQVVAAAVGTGVEDRALQGEASSFTKDVGTLFCHTTFEGDFPETQVEHVWKLGGAEMARVSLKAKGPRWRTWSRKTVTAENTGEWTVDIVAGGKTLKTVSFKVE